MAKVLPIEGGIDASTLRAGLARALAMEQGHAPFRKSMQLGDAPMWFKRAPNGEVTVFVGGSQARMSMDAGVIDLKSTAQASPLRYESGTRKDTGSTQGYNAGFATEKNGFLVNPSSVPAGQMVGTLSFHPFTGRLPPEFAAPSFRPKRKESDPPTDPVTWADDPADDALVAKKTMAKLVPASMFTGRTRLYVQAMYGRPLHQYVGKLAIEPQESKIGVPSARIAPGFSPALDVPAYRHPGEAADLYQPVPLDTNAGVHFDAATGKHWLLRITGDRLLAYPLLSSKAGEAARKYLVKPLPDKSTLSVTDKEKLEAFILAYCTPDVKNVQSADLGMASNGYSMGYGWHWNWSGTKADIVTSTNYDQGGGKAGMESTHRRVTATLTGGVWSGTNTLVEGPKRWSVPRVAWCIAEPEWATMATLKSTPKFSDYTVCDAPFYAFYDRDVLRLCRIAVAFMPGTPNVRTISVNFAQPTYGSVPEEFTGGMLDGFCQDAGETQLYYKATITAGAASADNLFLGKSSVKTRWDVYGKSEVIGPSRDTSSEGPIASGVSHTFEHGYFPPYGTPESTTVVGPGQFGPAFPATVELTRETSITTRDESSILTCVVPFYDAEAILLQTATFDHTSRGSRQVSIRRSQGFMSIKAWTPTSGATTFYRSFLTAGPGGIISSSTPDPIVTDVNTTSENLSCRAGTVPATMGELASFHDGEDYAQVTYHVLGGAADVSPVAVSPSGTIAPVGLVGPLPQFAALVGWI